MIARLIRHWIIRRALGYLRSPRAYSFLVQYLREARALLPDAEPDDDVNMVLHGIEFTQVHDELPIRQTIADFLHIQPPRRRPLIDLRGTEAESHADPLH